MSTERYTLIVEVDAPKGAKIEFGTSQIAVEELPGPIKVVLPEAGATAAAQDDFAKRVSSLLVPRRWPTSGVRKMTLELNVDLRERCDKYLYSRRTSEGVLTYRQFLEVLMSAYLTEVGY